MSDEAEQLRAIAAAIEDLAAKDNVDVAVEIPEIPINVSPAVGSQQVGGAQVGESDE